MSNTDEYAKLFADLPEGHNCTLVDLYLLPEPVPRIFNVLIRLRKFTVEELAAQFASTQAEAQTWADILLAKGYLEIQSSADHQRSVMGDLPPTYRLSLQHSVSSRKSHGHSWSHLDK